MAHNINEIAIKWQALNKGIRLANAVMRGDRTKVVNYAEDFANFAESVMAAMQKELNKEHGGA